MLKKIKVCLLLSIITIFLTGCSKLNPFAPPETEKSKEQQVTEYVDDVEEKIEDSELQADKDAEEFEENFDEKNQEVYYNALDKLTEPDTDNSDESLISSSLRGFYKIYILIKFSGVWICIGSIVLGAVGCFFSRHNKSGMKFFIVSFCVVVPIMVIVIVFGVGSLNQLFLG